MTNLVLVLVGLFAGAWYTARLRPLPGGTQHHGPLPRASLVIPARNEAGNLPTLLGSLRDLPAGTEVIVVDDGSTDDTAAIARAAGAQVISAPEPPDGWLGKPWACSLGARAASGDLLVFLDADVELAPGALEDLAAAHARHTPDGLLSVQPHHRVERVYEHASAFPNSVAMIATGCFSPRPRPHGSVAFGPCLVTSASAYRSVGGHAGVAGEVIEDVHLARAYQAQGRPVGCFAGADRLRFRMYPEGPAQLIEGWTKNLTGGARLAPWLPTLAGTLWVAAGLAIAAATAESLLGLRAGDGLRWSPIVAWLAYAAHLRYLLHRIGTFRGWAAWLYPLPLVAFVLLFLRSGLHRLVRREVRWRSRTIAWGRVGG